jgi:hypothetical protein
MLDRYGANVTRAKADTGVATNLGHTPHMSLAGVGRASGGEPCYTGVRNRILRRNFYAFCAHVMQFQAAESSRACG